MQGPLLGWDAVKGSPGCAEGKKSGLRRRFVGRLVAEGVCVAESCSSICGVWHPQATSSDASISD